MRVLNVYAGNLYGGIESMLVTIARNRSLCPGIDWGFALCFEGRLAEELRAAGVEVLSLEAVRLSRPWTVWRARRRLRAIIDGGAWEAVICHGSWPHAVAAPAVRRAGRSLIFWAHGPHGRTGLLDWWAGRRPPDLVIANSRTTRDDLRRTVFPTTRMEIVHCPVAAPALPDAAAIRQRLRTELGAAPETVVIVTSCRLDKWKGHLLLLDALERIGSKRMWQWWVSGGAQSREQEVYVESLRERVGRLGFEERVRFLGHRADVPQVLASADVHCQPNMGPEPFGIAFVEALYAGLPVVTTAQGGALEIVDETCGVLVPPGDVVGLAAALEGLIADPNRRRRLGAAGPARAALVSDPASRLADVERLLKSLNAQ